MLFEGRKIIVSDSKCEGRTDQVSHKILQCKAGFSGEARRDRPIP
jgi:hypothetical protein